MRQKGLHWESEISSSFFACMHPDVVGFGSDGIGEVVGSVSRHIVRTFLPQQTEYGHNLQSGNRYRRFKRGAAPSAWRVSSD